MGFLEVVFGAAFAIFVTIVTFNAAFAVSGKIAKWVETL